MMSTTEKLVLGVCLAVLTAPLWLWVLACMADNALRDAEYPYSGFCPDCPVWGPQ